LHLRHFGSPNPILARPTTVAGARGGRLGIDEPATGSGFRSLDVVEFGSERGLAYGRGRQFLAEARSFARQASLSLGQLCGVALQLSYPRLLHLRSRTRPGPPSLGLASDEFQS
jgi:hypothetical protein